MINLSKEDFNKFADIFRTMTGSKMSDYLMRKSYDELDKDRILNLFDRVNKMVEETNLPFDKAFPILKNSFNVLGEKENIDPAILLLIYTANKKK